MKPVVTEARFDFRGGRNTAISPDLLNQNELVDATNVRLSAVYGGFTKRNGSQRITANPAVFSAGPIQGLTQWDAPSGKQTVAICDGYLCYKPNDLTTEFTQVPGFPNPTIFPVGFPAFFVPFRGTASGAPLLLFIACGGKVGKWDGTALTDITGTNNVPAGDRLIAYHTRVFARDKNLVKHLFWSKVGDATVFTTLSKTDGGSALVDFLSGEQLIALEVIGSSLLLATPDCIMRFSGHASDDIVIAQDTEGVSSEIGVVSPFALKRFENVAAAYSERGPYAVTETYAEPIGEQLNPDWIALDALNLSKVSIEYNRGHKEVLFAVPRAGDSGTPKTIFAHAVRLQAWQGPWTYPFGITAMSKYFDTNNVPSILSGGSDGFVRLMDVGSKDDVLSNGTGGSNISMSAEIPTLHFGAPGTKKSLKWLLLQADLPTGSALNVQTSFDDGSFTAVPVTANPNGEQNYRVDLNGDGFRCHLKFTDASDKQPTIFGFVLVGWDYGRTT